jgi:hypothetical protein
VEELRRRLADPTFDLLAEALILRDEVGGDRFGACLEQVARGVRAQIALRGRLAAARAYQTTFGQEVLAVAALVIVVGYLLTLWLARLDEDERVLVRPG